MPPRGEGMEVGGVFALSTERELIVADRIAKMVPAAELVRFSNSGTEAVMAALRLARAYTGRDSYLLVEGGYHGLFDAAMWMANVDEWDAALATATPRSCPMARAFRSTLKELAHLDPDERLQRLEDIFKQHGDTHGRHADRADPGQLLRASRPQPNMSRLARELCDQIRRAADHRRGEDRLPRRQGRHPGRCMGVTPDITTFAKAVANGYPIAVVAGREEVMRTFRYGGAAHGGTYTAHSVSLAAAEECLRILDETPALETIASYGRTAEGGHLGHSGPRAASSIPITGHPRMFGLFFAETPPDNYRDWKTVRLQLLRHDGLSPA